MNLFAFISFELPQPLKRLSAEAALHHPWLETNGSRNSDRPLQHDVSLLHSRRRVVKRTMRGVIAASRMKALSLQLPDKLGRHETKRNMSLTDRLLMADISKYMDTLKKQRSR